jgi:hypothetical protein
MNSHPVDPRSWPIKTWPIKIPIIAHDVGRSNDRSTAVVGGHCPPFFGQQLLVQEFRELPVGIYGSQLANELAKIDQNYNRDCVIVADLSNDATYGEALFEMFGPRVIGVQIGRSGDGTTFERRRVKNGVIPVYNVGRTFLLELLLAKMREHQIHFLDSPESRRAFEQLVALEPEQRDSGIVYKCPAGQHDDLGISLALLAFGAQHLHLNAWQQPIFNAHRRSPPSPKFSWSSFV